MKKPHQPWGKETIHGPSPGYPGTFCDKTPAPSGQLFLVKTTYALKKRIHLLVD